MNFKSEEKFRLSEAMANELVLEFLERKIDLTNPKLKVINTHDGISYILEDSYIREGILKKVKTFISVREFLTILNYALKLKGYEDIYIKIVASEEEISYNVSYRVVANRGR